MRYPNAYNGIRKLFFIELAIALILATRTVFPLLAALRVIPVNYAANTPRWAVLVAFGLFTLLRLLALGRASQDELNFQFAQKSLVYAILLYLVYAFIVPHVVNFILEYSWKLSGYRNKSSLLAVAIPLCMEVAIIVMMVRNILFTLEGISNLGQRVRREDVHAQGQRLKLYVIILACFPLLAFVLSEILPSRIIRSTWFSLGSMFVLFVGILLIWILFLCYLKRGERMLRDAEPEDPWAPQPELADTPW